MCARKLNECTYNVQEKIRGKKVMGPRTLNTPRRALGRIDASIPDAVTWQQPRGHYELDELPSALEVIAPEALLRGAPVPSAWGAMIERSDV